MSDGSVKLAAVVCLTMMALTFVFLRYIARFRIIKNPGPDDVVILCSAVCTCGFMATTIVMFYFAASQSPLNLTKSSIISLGKSVLAGLIFYLIGVALTKIAIFILYMRIVATRLQRQICIGMMVYNVLFPIGAFVGFITRCQPIQAFWDPFIPGGHCSTNENVRYAIDTGDIVSNLILVIFPIFLLRSLQIPLERKVLLISVFAMGGIGVISSIIRIVKFRGEVNSKSWAADLFSITVWSAAELNIGIACACLPCLHPIARVLINNESVRAQQKRIVNLFSSSSS